MTNRGTAVAALGRARRERERRRNLRRAVLIALCVLAALFGVLGGLVLVDSVDLPEVTELEHFRPSTTTVVYDLHGEPIGSFATERRVAVPYEGFAPILREALISIEDKGFEHHFGVNPFRVVGAAWHDLRSKGRAQGASTLTMQLARNLFLTDKRTAGRKLEETLLSIQIEHTFTKQQIFTMYGNQIYLGHGTYGFEAGAEYYFSKHASDLTLPEAALLAGLPKGPEEFSPTEHPERALLRRNQVIAALLADGHITQEEAAAASASPLGLELEPPPNTEAPWFVEAVRRELDRRLGPDAVHGAGLRVYTTLDLQLQRAANRAVLDGLAAYERRHGWRGHLVNLHSLGVDVAAFRHPDWVLSPESDAYMHAVVDRVTAGAVLAHLGRSVTVELGPADWAWTGFRAASQFLHPGDVIYVHLTARVRNSDAAVLGAPGSVGMTGDAVLPDSSKAAAWRASLEEDTGAEGALLVLDNATGDTLAMVGGRDFALSQYNRATEAERQVGSSFKPYVYTAAVETGVTPDDRILDAPVSFGGYAPRDYEGNTLGDISVEQAFADSRNIPAVRLAARVGMPRVVETARRFGITSPIPQYLPVALGAVGITLAQQISAYSVFPNDGIRVPPRLIRRVADAEGNPVNEDNPSFPAPHAAAVISPSVARTMMRLLRAVTAPGGTAADAAQLDHPVGGKTGTTSNFTNAWFLGFSPSVTCGVWVGYDNRTPLGDGESGAKAALPIWMDLMRVADAAHPDEQFAGAVSDFPQH